MISVAAVQLSSQEEIAWNLANVRRLVGEAAKRGAEFVALPENFAFMGEEAKKRELAERLDGSFPGPILSTLCELSAKHGIFLLGGGMPEVSGQEARPYNTSVLVDPSGAVVATYRKIHLFDVSLADGTVLRESAATLAGSEVVTTEVQGVRLGMTICYDVRFPELYRKLVAEGARIITVPSAFTTTTGKDHWHVLLRARAIENQVYVVAPAQHGRHPKGRTTFGKSLIVDPWGDVIAQASEGEGVAMAHLNFEYQDRVRNMLPALHHRRW